MIPVTKSLNPTEVYRLNLELKEVRERILLQRMFPFFSKQLDRFTSAVRRRPRLISVSREAILNVLPTKSEEDELFGEYVKPLVEAVAGVFGQSTIDILLDTERSFDPYTYDPYEEPWVTRAGPDVGFDVYDSTVQHHLEDRSRVVASRVNNTTFRRVVPSLYQGYQNGETVDQLAGRVSSAFAGTDRATPWRARLIARTEVNGAAEMGNFFGGVQSGVVENKIWMTAQDERVRALPYNHVAANGEQVSLQQPFMRTGEALMYPSDINGSPGNIIQCRCTTLMVPFGFSDLLPPGTPPPPTSGPAPPTPPVTPPPAPPPPPPPPPPPAPPPPAPAPTRPPPSPAASGPLYESPEEMTKTARRFVIEDFNDRIGRSMREVELPTTKVVYHTAQDSFRRAYGGKSVQWVRGFHSLRGDGTGNVRKFIHQSPQVTRQVKRALKKRNFDALTEDEIQSLRIVLHEYGHSIGDRFPGDIRTRFARGNGGSVIEEGIVELTARLRMGKFLNRLGYDNVPDGFFVKGGSYREEVSFVINIATRLDKYTPDEISDWLYKIYFDGDRSRGISRIAKELVSFQVKRAGYTLPEGLGEGRMQTIIENIIGNFSSGTVNLETRKDLLSRVLRATTRTEVESHLSTAGITIT